MSRKTVRKYPKRKYSKNKYYRRKNIKAGMKNTLKYENKSSKRQKTMGQNEEYLSLKQELLDFGPEGKKFVEKNIYKNGVTFKTQGDWKEKSIKSMKQKLRRLKRESNPPGDLIRKELKIFHDYFQKIMDMGEQGRKYLEDRRIIQGNYRIDAVEHIISKEDLIEERKNLYNELKRFNDIMYQKIKSGSTKTLGHTVKETGETYYWTPKENIYLMIIISKYNENLDSVYHWDQITTDFNKSYNRSMEGIQRHYRKNKEKLIRIYDQYLSEVSEHELSDLDTMSMDLLPPEDQQDLLPFPESEPEDMSMNLLPFPESEPEDMSMDLLPFPESEPEDMSMIPLPGDEQEFSDLPKSSDIPQDTLEKIDEIVNQWITKHLEFLDGNFQTVYPDGNQFIYKGEKYEDKKAESRRLDRALTNISKGKYPTLPQSRMIRYIKEETGIQRTPGPISRKCAKKLKERMPSALSTDELNNLKSYIEENKN